MNHKLVALGWGHEASYGQNLTLIYLYVLLSVCLFFGSKLTQLDSEVLRVRIEGWNKNLDEIGNWLTFFIVESRTSKDQCFCFNFMQKCKRKTNKQLAETNRKYKICWALCFLRYEFWFECSSNYSEMKCISEPPPEVMVFTTNG